MVNYQESKIYKIWSPSTELVYYGATCNELHKRFSQHKAPSNTCVSKQIIDFGDSIIELIELFPCNSKIELHNREGYFIKNNECINKCVAGRTNKEYREDNKEHIANYYKLRDEKITCECGVILAKQSLNRHKKRKEHLKYLKNLE